MAVYTQLSKEQIADLIALYDCGNLVSFEGIVQGVENSNYKITTDQDRFILTIFEKRTNEADLPFFFNFMEHLNAHGIYCPFVVKDREEQRIQKVAGKSASVFSFLDGHNIEAATITPQKCAEMGTLLAQMHIAAQDFSLTRANSMSLSTWKDLAQKINGKQEYDALIDGELALAEKTLALDLPKGAVHADVFPDNVFERNGKIEGVIDFYFSSTDFYIYDLAITLNAWCFNNAEFDAARADQMLKSYQELRPLSHKEKAAFQDMLRAAALRILLTRSYDWIFHDPSALVKPKDPLEYKKILEFHVSHKIDC